MGVFHCKVLYSAFVHFGLYSYSSGFTVRPVSAVKELSSEFGIIVERLLFLYTNEVDESGDYGGSSYRNEESDQKHFPSPAVDVIT